MLIAAFRIRNQYLLSILALLVEIGAKEVSSLVMVEAWQAKGRKCDDVFFMHFDVLGTYRFISQTDGTDSVLDLDQLLAFNADSDRLVSITHEGREFLHRYGGR